MERDWGGIELILRKVRINEIDFNCEIMFNF